MLTIGNKAIPKGNIHSFVFLNTYVVALFDLVYNNGSRTYDCKVCRMLSSSLLS